MVFNDFNEISELYHHGIKGQKWGDKNGPPYPLDYEDHSAEQKRKNPKSVIGNYTEEAKAKEKVKKEKLSTKLAKAQTEYEITQYKIGTKATKEEYKREKQEYRQEQKAIKQSEERKKKISSVMKKILLGVGLVGVGLLLNKGKSSSSSGSGIGTALKDSVAGKSGNISNIFSNVGSNPISTALQITDYTIKDA